jgi:general secretion pathway protein K
MALLIVALVAGLGIKFASDYQFGLVRAESRWYGAQARIYSLSTEAAAIKVLADDDPNYDDDETERWGAVKDGYNLELEDGAGNLRAIMEDANSKFNLNSLVGQPLDPARDPNDPKAYTPSQRMFIRLLQTLKNPDDPGMPLVQSVSEATAILEAMVDWIDGDKTESGLNGAEVSYYTGLPDPYLPADRPFTSLDELAMVRGMTPALLRALRPLVTVLDPAERMNINTIDHIELFACINVASDLKPLDEARASSLKGATPTARYYAQAAEIDTSITSVFGSGEPVDKELTVKTNLFWLYTIVQMGDQRRMTRSLLKRGNPAFTVVSREDTYDMY